LLRPRGYLTGENVARRPSRRSGRRRRGRRRRFPPANPWKGVLSRKERQAALRLARRALERALDPSTDLSPLDPLESELLPPAFDEKRGVFVTLRSYPSDELRGCIGYPLPVLPLRTALARAAVAAALEDPRFAPVRAPELRSVSIETSVLSVPVVIEAPTPGQRVRSVRVGQDGLIVDGFGSSGLLLPQVAVEQGWTAEEFLNGASEKAGLPRHAWRDSRVTVRRFEAEVFRESSPGSDLPTEGSDLTRDDGASERRT
jgi:uncharacterized protein